MRCLYCGEQLAGAPEDATNPFCSIGHRQMYQWKRSSGGDGSEGSRTIAQLVAAAEAGEDGNGALGRLRVRQVKANNQQFGMRLTVVESSPFPDSRRTPESLPISEIGLYDAAEVYWPVEAATGPRKPRQPRGASFATFPISRMLPSRPLRRSIEMPLCVGTDVAAAVDMPLTMRRPKNERAMAFPAKAILGRMNAGLEVTEMDPLSPVVANLRQKVEAAKNAPPGSTEPPSNQLFPLGRIEPAERPIRARHGRNKEAIQWMAKVVDLEGIGRRLLDAQLASARLPGADGWKRGPVRAHIEPRAAAGLAGIRRRQERFADLRPKAGAGTMLPESRLSSRAAQMRAAAEAVAVEVICPPVFAPQVAARCALETAPEAIAVLKPSVPESRRVQGRPVLGVTFLIDGRTTLAAKPAVNLLFLETAFLDGDLQLEPVKPAIAQVLARRPSRTIEAARTLAPLEIAARPAPKASALTLETAFMLISPATPRPTGPAFPWKRKMLPPMSKSQFRLEPQSARAFTGSSFTQGELAPLNGEATRVVPKLKAELTQDERVAMAVQLYNETNSKNWFRRLNLPGFRKSSAKPKSPRSATTLRPEKMGPKRLKWALAGAPLILLAGYYGMRTSDTAPSAEEPQIETAAETKAAPGGPKTTVRSATPGPRRDARDAPTQNAGQNGAVSGTQAAGAVSSQGEQPGFLMSVKQAILKRAAVSLSDDFRSGLGDWQGYGEWSKQWSYDAATFLNTGPSVVLYTPSLGLANYRADFLGQIEKKSLGWVFRAKDQNNYHAAKITLTRGGPLPRAMVEHYVVIEGRADRHQTRPLPLEIRADTLYLVRTEVEGANFTISVQGQIVDHWSDNRLPSGGIGFFSARGEQSRLRWVEVSHQYDTLGRLCAFLAPYSLPAREGSQK